MSERVESAVARFKSGCNCCQSVVTAYCDVFGIDEKTAMRLACGFGGGLGRLRETCGAVSGMALLAGLRFGNEDPADVASRKRTYEAVQQMAAAFRERHGSLTCRVLLGLGQTENDPAPAERTAAYYQKRPCAEYVATAVEIAERFLLTPR